LLSFGYDGKSSRISRNEPYTKPLAKIRNTLYFQKLFYSAFFLLIISSKSYGQIDSITNKTWIGIGGDIFRLWESTNIETKVENKLNFNANYRERFKESTDHYYKCQSFTDSSLVLLEGYSHFRDYPNPASVNFKYFGDSLKIYPNSELRKVLQMNNVRREKDKHFIKNDTAIFYDSSYFSKSIPIFDSLILSKGTIRILKDGSLEKFYENIPSNHNTRRLGLYRGKLTKKQLLQLNSFMHISHFKYWDESCSSTHFGTGYVDVYYPDVTYNLQYHCNPARRAGSRFEFLLYIFQLINEIKLDFIHYQNETDVHYFNCFYGENQLIIGRPQLLSSFFTVNKKKEYLYKVISQEFIPRKDSITLAYFNSDTLIDTTKRYIFSLSTFQFSPIKLDESVFQNYYLIKDIFWAKEKIWIFQPCYDDIRYREQIKKIPDKKWYKTNRSLIEELTKYTVHSKK
jgi:hypothetical protein